MSEPSKFDQPPAIIALANGQQVSVRPVLPRDAAKLQTFVKNLSALSRNQRFLHALSQLSASVLESLTGIDYATHFALVAEVVRDKAASLIAEARYVISPQGDSAELAVAVADDWQGLGLAKALLSRLWARAAAAGVKRLTGEALASNDRLLDLARKAGFSIRPVPGSANLVALEKSLVL